MSVLVTGVRGGVGRLVADTLHARGEDVRGASSDPAGLAGAAFPVLPVDLRTARGLAAALDGVDRVFLYAAHDGADEIARLLREAGVERVVVLSSASVEIPGGEGIGGQHQAVEDAVRGYGGAWTFLRPGAFATNTLRWAPGVRHGRVALPYADAHVEPIHEADIADAAVAALTGAGHEGRAYFMTGGESLTQRRQVELIAAAAGRPVAVEDLDPEQWREQVAAFMPAPVADTLLGMWRGALDGPGRTDGTVRDITGATPRTFADWAADHADAFR
ncbi:NAD(P)H-binding protein [Streptantibioticus silvisoli]|uniref:NAD(P)H-binding protein n=1 Tax=Streptantibioticus silvisoli TaxID=2705255 RepID=A0ABT6W5A5_9ACTN|nr:NAD(P)H-binding protein [Streptantibioticus silvisoli]MDI5965560.1 NAD(P)H-binding protein [Streptantibioticus silvisoli]